ncbi:HET-domain-containing protein [Hyaloscypha variabilis F]|uniref:HET-domain-containing protein n=1 Tax=Hyaloscypha variabilis (strain UAMH 11265 / GT02V1 / F) TaxID=1149755 RepID=A0A2J6QRN3_HYAVF|nr:HET-domain-containing protein [Hyaloscypha variabilis F]
MSNRRRPTATPHSRHRGFSPHLYESNDDLSGNWEYAALSHCWGTAPMFTKTMATLMDRKSAIPWDLLPKTFQEAIIITHELGLQYIWIDSLCIIQDDDSDWEKESMRMQTIYGRSKVTIAAVESKDGNGGCFVQDNSTFQFTHGTPGLARPFAIRVCPSHNGYDHYPTLGAKQMPLFSRAWSFQEELLSPRVLYYGPEEVVFQCRTSLDYRAFNNSSVSESSFAWPRIVEEYENRGINGRFLTHETDKFPALSGLAKEFKNMGLGDYVAGMWTTELPLRLGWRCRSVGVGPRTDVYLAPTWSWASLKAETETLESTVFS